MTGSFNGFPIPYVGASSFLSDAAREAAQDLSEGVITRSPNGAVARFETFEVDVPTPSGSIALLPSFVPAFGHVFAVSAVVVETITGSLAGWSLGRFGNPSQYLGSVGVAAGTSAVHVPTGVLSASSIQGLLISAVDGTFAGGKVRIAAHVMHFTPPAP